MKLLTRKLAARHRSPRHLVVRRLQLHLVRQSTDGAILPFVILTVLVVIVGVATLANRSFESKLSSVRQSDYATAREAAEYGMNFVLGKLNTNDLGYLLVSNFGTSGAGWTGISSSNLDSCRIRYTGTPGSTAASAVVGVKTLPNISAASFSVTGYLAPKFPTGVTASTTPNCSQFGNLFGGLATITVTGTVQRPTGTQVATYTLSRNVHVVRSGLNKLSNYPLILIGTGSALDKSDLQGSGVSQFFLADNPSTNTSGSTPVDIACANGPASTCLTTVPSMPVDNASTFLFPNPNPNSTASATLTTLGVDTTVAPTAVALSSATTTSLDNIYPFATAVPTAGSSDATVTAALRPECTLNAPSADASIKAINCRITSLQTADNNNFRINTSFYPVNMLVSGSITIGRGSALGASAVISSPSSSSAASDWKRVRFFGTTTGSTCASQAITIDGTGHLQAHFHGFQGAQLPMVRAAVAAAMALILVLRGSVDLLAPAARISPMACQRMPPRASARSSNIGFSTPHPNGIVATIPTRFPEV